VKYWNPTQGTRFIIILKRKKMKHFCFKKFSEPWKNIIFQRFKFISCGQLEGQGFDEFATELKN